MNDKMSLYNFYIDTELKKAAMEKLDKELGRTGKGAFSALLRVLVKDYVHSPTDTQLLSRVAKEYTTSTKRNKRSKL